MTIYFIQPDECVTPSRYGLWLDQWGVPTRTLHPNQLSTPPAASGTIDTADGGPITSATAVEKTDSASMPDIMTDASGIILLGGRMSALDDATHPWLQTIYSLVHAAVKNHVPVLGICLGHQIIAQALGGRVELNSSSGAQEGPYSVALTAAGAQDPVLGPLGTFGDLVLYESHNDVVAELPPGATELATSAECPVQAFRYGSAWGVQFHPEAAPDDMERWWQLGHPSESHEAKKHRSLCEASDPLTETLGRTLLRAFVEHTGVQQEELPATS